MTPLLRFPSGIRYLKRKKKTIALCYYFLDVFVYLLSSKEPTTVKALGIILHNACKKPSVAMEINAVYCIDTFLLSKSSIDTSHY